MPRSSLPWWLALAIGCGEEGLPPAELAPVCGAPEPVQLLALRDDEVVIDSAVAHDDRLLLGVRRYEVPILDIDLARARQPHRRFAQIDARIESVDGCGGDRRVIAAGYDQLLPPREPDGPWLALRSEDFALAWIDPDGAFAPRALPGATLDTLPQVRGDAVVLEHPRDASHRELWHATLTPGTAAPTTTRLAGDLAWTGLSGLSAAVDEVLALRNDGVLLAVPLDPAREAVAVLGAVATAQTDAAQRYVLWQPGRPPATTVPEQGWLVDRETGGSIPLATGDGATLSPVLRGSLGFVAHESPAITPWTEIIAMPGGQRMRVDEVNVNGDGRIVAGRFALLLGVEWKVFQIVDDAIVSIALPSGADWSSYRDGVLYVRDDRGAAGISFIPEGRPFDLLVAPLQTYTPSLVVEDAWSGIALPRGRYLGPADLRATIGPLVVIDGGWQTLVDRDVHAHSLLLAPDATLELEPWHTDDVIYEVRARPSTRNGLWRVRFE
ncbi:MAG: hypothetical protein U0168_08295 [Nannocystaceae bacterium]